MSRQFHPHAVRTASVVAEHLAHQLPAAGRVLEVASGSGQQLVAFATRCPGLTWLGSELDPAARASIAAWRDHAGLANLLPPIALDVRAVPWLVEDVDVVVAVRLAHVLAPSELAALFVGAHAIAKRIIVIGPLAEAPSPAPVVPSHLAAWTVATRIPTRAELRVAATGLRWTHDEPVGTDHLIVFER